MTRLIIFSLFYILYQTKGFTQKYGTIQQYEHLQEVWRVEIYRGKDKEKAIEAKKKAYQIKKEYFGYANYGNATYRVQVGNFTDSTICEKVLIEMKTYFPQAKVIKAKVRKF